MLGELGDKSGKEAVDKITHCLDDDDWSVCREAAKSLGKMGRLAESAASSLKNFTTNEEVTIRLAAIRALGKIGNASSDSVQSLQNALKDSNEEVRAEAAKSLGSLGPDAFAAIQDLMRSLKDASWNVRTQSAKAISDIGKNSVEAIPTLINALGDRDWRVRFRVVNTLTQIGEASIPNLLEKISIAEIKRSSKLRNLNKHTNLGLNIMMVSPLIYIATFIFLLLNLSSWMYMLLVVPFFFGLGVLIFIKGHYIEINKNKVARKTAVEALGELKTPTPEVIKQLSVMLNDKKEEVRGKAADSLRSLGEKSVNALLNALSRAKTTKSKILIISALGGIRNEAKDSIPYLSELLANSGTPIRVEIVRTFGNIGIFSDEIRLALITALKDPKSIVRREAALSMGKFGKIASDVVPSLLDALNDKKPDVRWRSSEALGKIKLNTPEVLTSLKALIHDECDYVCESADIAIDYIIDTDTDTDTDMKFISK